MPLAALVELRRGRATIGSTRLPARDRRAPTRKQASRSRADACRPGRGPGRSPRLASRGDVAQPCRALPEQHSDGDPDRVDRDVERRAQSPGYEHLVQLVAHRVERSERERDALLGRSLARGAPPAPRTRRRARACAGRDPSPRARCRGREPRRTRRSARPRPARGATGARRTPTPSDDRLGSDQRSTVREPGASPGRSRRCKGSCSPATTPLASGSGRRRGREPRVRRPAVPPT